MHPFRFGVHAQPGGNNDTNSKQFSSSWRMLARRVEDLGYSTLLVPDHFGDYWAPLFAMTVAAEATSTLRVGSLVFDNDYRHPVELAREVATLDLASGGRVECGIGAGWMRSDYNQLGLAFDPPGVRIDRMLEGVIIMKDLWANGTSTRTGAHYNVRDARCLPTLARPHPTLIVGGGGRRASIHHYQTASWTRKL
jgi:probable F420-dependent oxidoreductase